MLTGMLGSAIAQGATIARVTAFAQAASQGWSFGAATLRFLSALLVGVAVFFVLFGLLPRVFPRRCPRCRTPVVKTVERVYEGEHRPVIVLPPIDLIRWTCPSCGNETREVKPDVNTPPWFAAGKKSRWFGARHGDTPEEMTAAIGSVMEWDRILSRLKNEYETPGR